MDMIKHPGKRLAKVQHTFSTSASRRAKSYSLFLSLLFTSSRACLNSSPDLYSPYTRSPSLTYDSVMICGLRIHFPLASFRTGTHFEMRPLRYILYADHISQLMQLHMASSMERYHGRKSEAPPTGADPWRGPAWPKMARSEETVRSQAVPISCPPATLMPFTLQMTGFLHMRMESTILLKSSM